MGRVRGHLVLLGGLAQAEQMTFFLADLNTIKGEVYVDLIIL
jgi:hypothetical protein